jgi:hypothetical protein
MPAPANDTCATAEVIAALPFSDTVDVTDATAGPDTTCITDAEHTIWYSWTALSITPVGFTLSDDRAWGSVLTVYVGTCGTLTEVFCDELYGGATGYLVPTSGVTYLIQCSVYDGVLGSFPSVSLTVTLDEVERPPEPVLSGSSTTGRTVSLTWASLVGTTAETVSIERSLDGSAWTVVTSVGTIGPYHDRDLLSETLYYHRARTHHATLGYSVYSDVISTTTLAATVGVVQYAFAVGATGGFERQQLVDDDGDPFGSAFPPTWNLSGVFELWQNWTTHTTWVGSDSYDAYNLCVKYVCNTVTMVVTTTGAPLSTSNLPNGGEVQITNPNHRLDCWGTLGSCDTLVGYHRADGSLTLRLDGVDLITLTDLPLGTFGTPGYTNVAIHPAGAPTVAGDQNGGLTHLSIGTTADIGAADAYDYVFATLTDDDLFTSGTGPWVEHNVHTEVPGVPHIWDVGTGPRLSNSSAETGYTRGWMDLEPGSPLTPPDIWVVPEPEPEPDPPGTTPPSYSLDVHYIRRLRRAPHVANEHKRVFYRRFELDLERGQALASGQGSDPQVLFRLSRDGGQTWSEELRLDAGAQGDYQSRVMARRLGQARDCVFEIVVSDPVAWRIVGAFLEIEPGQH